MTKSHHQSIQMVILRCAPNHDGHIQEPLSRKQTLQNSPRNKNNYVKQQSTTLTYREDKMNTNNAGKQQHNFD